MTLVSHPLDGGKSRRRRRSRVTRRRRSRSPASRLRSSVRRLSRTLKRISRPRIIILQRPQLPRSPQRTRYTYSASTRNFSRSPKGPLRPQEYVMTTPSGAQRYYQLRSPLR